MRKHVKPAHPDATIPDPSRGGDLPAAGLPCEWSVHWARLEMRGDVIVTDIEPEAPTNEERRDPAFFDLGSQGRAPALTDEMHERLRAAGLGDDEIAHPTPAEAHDWLAEHPSAPAA